MRTIMSSDLENLPYVKNHAIEGQVWREDRLVVETFHSFDALVPMQQEWDDFIESVDGEVFLTFDWCRVWWKYYGKDRSLSVFVFRKGDSLCGILPMFGERVRIGPVSIKVLRIVGTDFTPVVVTIPIQKHLLIESLQSLLTEINNNKSQWDVLHLGPICGRYGSFPALKEACAKSSEHRFRIKETGGGVHTYIKLAGSWTEQLASLSSKHRSEIKRKYDRLLQNGFSLECVDATNDNFPQMFDEFVNTHQLHWNNLGRPGHFRAWPLAYKFHREIAAIQLKLKRLRFYQLKLNGDCIGYRYAYKFGDTYYCFLYARKAMEQSAKIDFARIDFGEIVKRGIAEKVKWLDSMRGEYHHKSQIGGQLFNVKNIYIYPKRLQSLVKVPLFRGLARALDICYYKIWRARIVPKVGSKPRPLWRLWIRTNNLTG